MSGTLCHWPPSAWTMGSWTEWLCWQGWRLSKGQIACTLSRQCPSSYSHCQMSDLATIERPILSSRYGITPWGNQSSFCLEKGNISFWPGLTHILGKYLLFLSTVLQPASLSKSSEYLVYWCGILYNTTQTMGLLYGKGDMGMDAWPSDSVTVPHNTTSRKLIPWQTGRRALWRYNQGTA